MKNSIYSKKEQRKAAMDTIKAIGPLRFIAALPILLLYELSGR